MHNSTPHHFSKMAAFPIELTEWAIFPKEPKADISNFIIKIDIFIV